VHLDGNCIYLSLSVSLRKPSRDESINSIQTKGKLVIARTALQLNEHDYNNDESTSHNLTHL
jgi:hypothetical protein